MLMEPKFEIGEKVYIQSENKYGNITHVSTTGGGISYRVEGYISMWGGLYRGEDKLHRLSLDERLARIEKELGLEG